MGTVSLAILSLERCRANEGKVFVSFFYFKFELCGEICSCCFTYSVLCLPSCHSSEDLKSILVAYKEFPVCSCWNGLDEYFHRKEGGV